jgi:hypothetical protein
VKKPTAEWDVPQGMVLVPGGQLRGKNGQLKTLPAFFLQQHPSIFILDPACCFFSNKTHFT